MERSKIIAYLKANPEKNIGRCAYALKVPEMEVTLAQVWTLRNLPRNSASWGTYNESVIKK